jgi:hypothetical protein
MQRRKSKKNLSADKPDSVLLPCFNMLSMTTVAIIYLAATLLLQSCCLPFPISEIRNSKRAAYLVQQVK